MPQLKGCYYVLFREFIVRCSIFEKIDSYRVSSAVIMLDEDPESKDDKINLKQRINDLMKCHLDHEDCVSFCVPFHLTLRLNLGTGFLFSGGELSHP